MKILNIFYIFVGLSQCGSPTGGSPTKCDRTTKHGGPTKKRPVRLGQAFV